MPVLQIKTASQNVVVVQTTVANVTGGGGGGLPSAHASTHESGGSDLVHLGSLTGSLTAAQHGTLATGDPHPQYATDADVATLQTNVDNLAAGMRFKDRVRVATTNNVNIANPGSAVIDGVTLASGDTVLLVGQTAASQNGAYTFNGSGSAMTRRTDSDTSAEVKAATVYPVAEGTFADQLALLTTNDPITIGTTALAFQFIAPGAGISSSIVDAKGDLIVGLADNTVGRFPAGANGTIPIFDSTQPFGMRAGTPTASSAGVFGSPDAELAAPTAVGAASLAVTRGSPSAIFNNRLVMLGIGTPSNFEARQVISLSGNTFALGNALNFPHAAGEPIYWLKDATVTPWHYGANGQPGVLDDGPQLQRMFLDASILAIPVGGLSGLRIYGGGGPVASGTVPLYIPGSLVEELYLHIGNGPGTTPFQAGQYAVKTCREVGQVTATGSHRLTIANGVFADSALVFVDHKIAFTDSCTPGGSFPTGIIPGHVYGVRQTAGNAGSWFTIYDWDDVTKAEVAVGTGGTGWYFTNMDNQAHHNWKHVRIHTYGFRQNGVSIACQQQSAFQGLYLEHGTDQVNNRDATMFAVQGQGGRFDDLTVRVLGKTIGVAYDASTLQNFQNYFSVIAEWGTSDTTPAVTVNNSFGLKWDGHWFESRGMIEIIANCQTLDFGTPHLGGSQINDLTSGLASWQMGMAQSSNASSDIVYSHDGFRPFTINGGTGGHGDADGGGAFFGIIKPGNRPPVFPYRTTQSNVGSGPLSIWNQIVLVNGPAALTIAQKDIIEGVDWIIKRQNTTGSVTVTPASPATITDATGAVSSALTITTSAAVHIVCSGGNIYVI